MWLINLLNGHENINSDMITLTHSVPLKLSHFLDVVQYQLCTCWWFWITIMFSFGILPQFLSTPYNLPYFSKTGEKVKLCWIKYVLNQPTSDVVSVEVNTAFHTIFEDTVCSLQQIKLTINHWYGITILVALDQHQYHQCCNHQHHVTDDHHSWCWVIVGQSLLVWFVHSITTIITDSWVPRFCGVLRIWYCTTGSNMPCIASKIRIGCLHICWRCPCNTSSKTWWSIIRNLTHCRICWCWESRRHHVWWSVNVATDAWIWRLPR